MVGIRIRRVLVRRSRKSLRPSRSGHQRWRTTRTNACRRMTSSCSLGARQMTLSKDLRGIARGRIRGNNKGGNGRTLRRKLGKMSQRIANRRNIPGARKVVATVQLPRGVPSSMMVSETRQESRGTAAAKAEECTKESKE